MLADREPFKVSGLTLNEAAAEKILGWCLKEDLDKHLGDLAILARDHREELDRARVVDLVAEKFKREKKAPETRSLYLGFDTPVDLTRVFLAEDRLERLRAGWASGIGTRVWLRPTEMHKEQSIAEPENVEALIREYWAEAIEALPSDLG